MMRVLAILAAVVALAVSAAPGYTISDGTSNTRLAAFPPPTSPATPPGVPIPYPNFPDPVKGPTRPTKVKRELARHVLAAVAKASEAGSASSHPGLQGS